MYVTSNWCVWLTLFSVGFFQFRRCTASRDLRSTLYASMKCLANFFSFKPYTARSRSFYNTCQRVDRTRPMCLPAAIAGATAGTGRVQHAHATTSTELATLVDDATRSHTSNHFDKMARLLSCLRSL